METGITVGLASEEVDVTPANITETTKKTYYVGPAMFNNGCGCGCNGGGGFVYTNGCGGGYYNNGGWNYWNDPYAVNARRIARNEAANDLLVSRYAARRSASDVFSSKASTSRGAAWAAGVGAGVLGLLGAGVAIYAATRASTLTDLARIEDSDIEDMGVDAGINNVRSLF